MGQNASNNSPKGALISIDWLVLAVAIFALALLLLTLPRGGTAPTPGGLGGLNVLQDRDQLIAFQDFGFDAEGWTPSVTEDRLAGLGPILGRFMNERLERNIALPEGSQAVFLQFDLHLAGAWQAESAIMISLGETEAVRIPWPEEGGGDAPSAILENVFLNVQRLDIEVPTVEATLAGPSPGLASYAVSMRVIDVAGEITLGFEPAMPVDVVGASWAIDNFRAVARTEGP